ncbi:MAG: hypothetical protein JWM80_4515, partial [Cyanobacteria bacterium RYN_339]|nr:hypothetical protein [Cyanobacteria bacterium RYN_339]
MSARTPLAHALRRAVSVGWQGLAADAPPLDELIQRPIPRRAFLNGLAGAGAMGILAACGVAPAGAVGR